jgi:predicted transcriptional regulator
MKAGKTLFTRSLDFDTRVAIRAEVAAAVKAGELKKVIYQRIALREKVSVTTISRTVNGR